MDQAPGILLLPKTKDVQLRELSLPFCITLKFLFHRFHFRFYETCLFHDSTIDGDAIDVQFWINGVLSEVCRRKFYCHLRLLLPHILSVRQDPRAFFHSDHLYFTFLRNFYRTLGTRIVSVDHSWRHHYRHHRRYHQEYNILYHICLASYTRVSSTSCCKLPLFYWVIVSL